MPSVRRPWITWTDVILSVLTVVCLATVSWLQYRDGLYFKIEGGVAALCMLVATPVLVFFILFRPWLNGQELAQWHQLWIRPALLVGIGLSVSWLWSLNLFNEPGVSSFLSGCRDAVRYTVSQEDIEELRRIVAERVRQGNSSEDSLRLSVDQLPQTFHRCSWGEPRLEPLQPHRRGVEIEVFWGGTLSGWFGLSIDPEVLPVEGITEPYEGAFRWHYKLSEGVYFFHTNG